MLYKWSCYKIFDKHIDIDETEIKYNVTLVRIILQYQYKFHWVGGATLNTIHARMKFSQVVTIILTSKAVHVISGSFWNPEMQIMIFPSDHSTACSAWLVYYNLAISLVVIT